MSENKETKNSQAKIEANNRYFKKTYDKITVAVPKGQKEIITEHAQKHGESINAYINRAILNQMKTEEGQ